ncbi:hypothetical protein OROHE_012584 [Orobanche hederae]
MSTSFTLLQAYQESDISFRLAAPYLPWSSSGDMFGSLIINTT